MKTTLRTTKELILRCWRGFQWKLILLSAALLAIVFGPIRAVAQLGVDPCCAIISAGLTTISALLQNVVAKPLSSIQQIQQQAADFQQQIIFPLSAINNARGLVTQIQSQLRQVSQLYRLPTSSATLPGPQQLEAAMLSHNPQNNQLLSQSYVGVYGPVMSPTDAEQPLRDIVDMSDAEAQAALKKAVQIDALADLEIAAADRINQELQAAAPGSAPILDAEAATWLVRGNAYTQVALAELLRLRSIDIADSAAQLKFGASDMNNLRNSTIQSLQR